MGPPPLVDISLDKLEQALNSLDEKFAAKIRLREVAFDRASNESLGFPNASTDFTVFMPSPDLRIRNAQGSFPSTSQQAFMDVVDEGLKRKDTKAILIDIAALFPEASYLNSGGDDSIMAKIGATLKQLGEDDPKRPVIVRMLVGGSDMNKSWDDLRGRYESIFWTPEGKSYIDHPDATLYVGFYAPNFAPSKDDKDIENIKKCLHKIVTDAFDLIGVNQITSILQLVGSLTSATQVKDQIDALNKLVDVNAIVDQIVVDTIPTITWNHGKVVAINGIAMMTGGINYISPYTASGNHDICDHSARVKGDAAVSAHRWADYFWKYLSEKSSSDGNSLCRRANLSENSPVWTEAGPVPDSQENFQRSVNQKQLETLTISKLGDWWGDMAPIRYPIQLFDAVRDIILNLSWQWLVVNLPAYRLLEVSFFKLAFGLDDETLSKDKFHSFKDVGINPCAWASRYSRTQAIQYANHSVVLCQPMVADYLQCDQPAWKKFVEKANDKLNLPAGKQWNGYIWPFDLLIALARALGNMTRSKTPDPRPGSKEYQKDSKGIYIVLTTNKIDGTEKTWEDRTSIKELMERLTLIMQNLPTEHGGIPTGQIAGALKKFIHFKRTGSKNDPEGKDLYSHSKICCVDGKVMYVGSDNAYPSYNEEHGIWIEDQKTIETWLDAFFTGYWKKLQDPTDI